MTTKKRILLFGKLPPPFIGPAVATKIILESSLNNYFDIIHFNLSHHKNINELGKTTFKNILSPFLLYFKLFYCLLRYRPDCVYMPSQQSTIAFYRDIPYILISKLFGKKVILHLRGANFLNWYNDCNNLVKFTVRQTQKIINGQIVLGNNLRYLFTQFMPEEKIFVIPNGAKLNYKDRITNKSEINISFLGNYTRTKGIIDFIKSTTLLSEDYYDQINFQMAGHWREKDCEIETKLLLNDNRGVPINNMGPMIGKNKLKYLYNSDIFVYPTLNDGHPWVIVEAMAAGLPIISTDQGAIVESVIDGKNGFIVEKNNPEQIAKKIQFLIDNPKIRIEMGKKSREMYLNKFTEEKLVENFKNVFNNVLNN